MTNAAKSSRVNRLALVKLDELDDALEMMYFGLKGMTREADDVLGQYGLSRSHHRILFVIARRDGLTISDLRASLGVSAQAMHRPLKQLADTGMVAVSRNPVKHRYKALHLTALGRSVENDASGAERRVIRDAFTRAGANAASAWSMIMSTIAENA